jgi:hypothetical protein
MHLAIAIVSAGCLLILPPAAKAQEPPRSVRRADTEENHGKLLATRAVERLAMGNAFDAKLRQRIWTGGREVVGIGYYEQSGGGTARYSLEMTVHDGDLRHHSRQISDGKLAWVRTQLAEEITLRRVDLGRIDEFYREVVRQGLAKESRSSGNAKLIGGVANDQSVPPWMRVGGLVELIDQIASDYDLRVSKGKVDDEPVWILRGEITEAAKNRVLGEAEGSTWSPLSPFEVRVAIAATGDESGFGVGLPKRIEFWGQPPEDEDKERPTTTDGVPPTTTDGQPIDEPESPAPPTAHEIPRGRLISLLEIYAIRRIEPSPEERFRFEREERDVSFSNDTRRYLQQIAVRSITGTRRPLDSGP